MPPSCPDCILHTFPQRLEEGWERVHKRGYAMVDKEIAHPSISPPAPPPPLCAQRHQHHGDIETDISLLDERGISVTQAPKVNVVWVSKQLLVYCGAGEGLKGTITPPKAIKGNCSVHTSDKLFVALPAHKDICLFAIVCEALTKFVPVEVTVVSLHLFSFTAQQQQAFHLQIWSPVGAFALSFIICASDYAWDKPDSLKSLSSLPGGLHDSTYIFNILLKLKSCTL